MGKLVLLLHGMKSSFRPIHGTDLILALFLDLDDVDGFGSVAGLAMEKSFSTFPALLS